MAHTAKVAVRLASAADAAAVAGALGLEAGDGPEGSRAAVRQEGATVQVDVEAATLADLRAALNALVRLLDTAARTVAPPADRQNA